MAEIYHDLVQVALRVADAADNETLRWFRRSDLIADNKEPAAFDPVTQADKAAEIAMRTVLSDLRPDDAVLGEEHGLTDGTTGLQWVLDPIDGTRGYMSGTPTWGTLIGVGPESGPKVGVISQPYTGERFVGHPGGAELHRGGQVTSITVRPTSDLSNAIIFTTFPEVGTDIERAGFDAVSSKCKLTRYGMDCYAYGLLAAGQIDLVIEAGLHPYDIQGPMAVVQAAGGIVTTWDGGSAHMGGRIIAAATQDLHEQAMEILRGVTNG